MCSVFTLIARLDFERSDIYEEKIQPKEKPPAWCEHVLISESHHQSI